MLRCAAPLLGVDGAAAADAAAAADTHALAARRSGNTPGGSCTGKRLVDERGSSGSSGGVPLRGKGTIGSSGSDAAAAGRGAEARSSEINLAGAPAPAGSSTAPSRSWVPHGARTNFSGGSHIRGRWRMLAVQRRQVPNYPDYPNYPPYSPDPPGARSRTSGRTLRKRVGFCWRALCWRAGVGF